MEARTFIRVSVWRGSTAYQAWSWEARTAVESSGCDPQTELFGASYRICFMGGGIHPPLGYLFIFKNPRLLLLFLKDMVFTAV